MRKQAFLIVPIIFCILSLTVSGAAIINDDANAGIAFPNPQPHPLAFS